jgi:hypothetical protein
MWRSLVAHLTGGQGVAGFGLVVLAVLLSVFAYLGLKITMFPKNSPKWQKKTHPSGKPGAG